MIKILFYLGLIFVSAIVCVRYIERATLFVPFKDVLTTPKNLNLVFSDVYFQTPDLKRINAWFVPFQDARKTVYFLHGNAGNLSHRLEKIKVFHDIGLNVFIIDYRGYGKSSGSPNEAGVYIDAQAGLNYLTKELNIALDSIILYGESLGSAVAIEIASKNKIGGIIVEGAFTSAKEIARQVYPFLPAFLLSIKLDSLSKIGKLSCPKLFIHSKNDEIVPYCLGMRLYQAASGQKDFFSIYGGHNDCFYLFKDQIREKISVYEKQT